MYKGTLIDNLLGVVESAEKSGRQPSAPEAHRKDESKSEGGNEGEDQSPNSSRNRLV